MPGQRASARGARAGLTARHGSLAWRRTTRSTETAERSAAPGHRSPCRQGGALNSAGGRSSVSMSGPITAISAASTRCQPAAGPPALGSGGTGVISRYRSRSSMGRDRRGGWCGGSQVAVSEQAQACGAAASSPDPSEHGGMVSRISSSAARSTNGQMAKTGPWRLPEEDTGAVCRISREPTRTGPRSLSRPRRALPKRALKPEHRIPAVRTFQLQASMLMTSITIFRTRHTR